MQLQLHTRHNATRHTEKSNMEIGDKYSHVQDLLAQVHHELAEERHQGEEWTRLEQANSSLRRSLHSLVHAQHRSLVVDGCADQPSSREQALLLLRTTSFLASSSALLRHQLHAAWAEQRSAQITLSTLAIDSSGAAAPSTHDQQCDLEWVLHSLPQPEPNTTAKGKTPTLPSIPPSPAPLPLVSHQSPYCSLEYPLARVSREWRSYFPADELVLGQAGGEADLRGWETLLEEIWDSLQRNRTLYEEWLLSTKGSSGHAAPAHAAASSLSAAAPPVPVASASASARLASGDSVMSHAQENYGFMLDANLHASMLGLGAVVPSHGVVPQAQHAAYEFDEADSPANIVMESEPTGDVSSAAATRSIKCATLNKLIERVTHENHVDLNTRYVFLLTYHSFTTPRELLAKLSRRFHVPLPPHLAPSELAHFKTTKLDRIQIRVCSVLKNWIDEHWADFADDAALKTDMHALIHHMLENSGSLLTTQLAKALQALVKRKERSSDAVPTTPAGPTHAPTKLLSGKPDTYDLMSVDEADLARQLTLMDFAKFRSIQPRECLNQNWSRAHKATLAPNILAMINQFNKVSQWVQITILKEKEVKIRSKAYEKFIKIAEHCRSLNNFNSLFAIYCGLTSNPIHRLRRTKAGVSSKLAKRFGEFAELFRGDKNSRTFRRTLQQSLTPCIPHLGIFLSDLTFTEDGNPDLLLGNMVNFQKRCKLAERIRWIQQYQQQGYTDITSIAGIQEYLTQQWNFVNLDEESLWRMSLTVEPKKDTTGVNK